MKSMKMKSIKLLSLSLLGLGFAGCASKPAVRTVYVRELSPSTAERETVQRSSFLKAYPLGRYVDPADPTVLHEGHVIYVEEVPSSWNLYPHRPVFVPLGPAAAPPDPARAPAPTAEELRREFDAQSRVVRALTNQAERIFEAQSQLKAVVPMVKQSVEQTVALQQQQRVIEERMRLLEDGLRPKTRDATTNLPPVIPPSKDW